MTTTGPRPLCLHCGEKPAGRPRQLCWGCYYSPGVRGQYAMLAGGYSAANSPDLPPAPEPISDVDAPGLCRCGKPLKSYQSACEDCTVAGWVRCGLRRLPGGSVVRMPA